MYYFYILRSLKSQKLYIGQTTDLKARLKSHNNGENKATKPNIPYKIIFYCGFINEKDAVNCEKYFKSTSGWKRMHRMLENTLDRRNLALGNYIKQNIPRWKIEPNNSII